MSKRVVITGVGVITPLGNDIESTWTKLVNGISGIEPISKFDTEKFSVKVAGEVKDFQPEKFIDKKKSEEWGGIHNLLLLPVKWLSKMQD